jgi:probable F420-dependent oxidoreductase
MRLGVTVPATGGLPDGGALIDVGSAAEVAGADGLWVTDHAFAAVQGARGHGAASVVEPPGPVYDALTCCAYLAAATLACRVGTACLVLPQHEPFTLAKAAASLDRMSAGRLVLGVGPGSDRREMEALGYDYLTREARLDEMLQVLRDLWTGRSARDRGEHVRVAAGLVLDPVPVAAPAGPPLVLVGRGEDVLRRAADLGDGWLSVAHVAALEGEALAADISRVRALHRDSGRSGPFEVVVKLHHAQGEDEQLVDAALLAQQAGADEVIVDIPWDRLDTSIVRLQAITSAIHH